MQVTSLLAVPPPGAVRGSRARVCGPAHRLGSSFPYTCSLLSGARVVIGPGVRQGAVMWPVTEEPGLQTSFKFKFKILRHRFCQRKLSAPGSGPPGQAAGLWALSHSSSLLSKHGRPSHSHSSPRSPVVQRWVDSHWHFKLMVVKMELNSRPPPLPQSGLLCESIIL